MTRNTYNCESKLSTFVIVSTFDTGEVRVAHGFCMIRAIIVNKTLNRGTRGTSNTFKRVSHVHIGEDRTRFVGTRARDTAASRTLRSSRGFSKRKGQTSHTIIETIEMVSTRLDTSTRAAVDLTSSEDRKLSTVVGRGTSNASPIGALRECRIFAIEVRGALSVVTTKGRIANSVTTKQVSALVIGSALNALSGDSRSVAMTQENVARRRSIISTGIAI